MLIKTAMRVWTVLNAMRWWCTETQLLYKTIRWDKREWLQFEGDQWNSKTHALNKRACSDIYFQMPGGSALFLRNFAILASELHKGLPGLRCGNQSITHDPPWLDNSENIVRGQSLSHSSWHNCVEALARSISALTHALFPFQNTQANILFGHSIDATRKICSTTSPHECVEFLSKRRIWRPNKLALHGAVIPKRRILRATLMLQALVRKLQFLHTTCSICPAAVILSIAELSFFTPAVGAAKQIFLSTARTLVRLAKLS